jgi:hypothetical protein
MFMYIYEHAYYLLSSALRERRRLAGGSGWWAADQSRSVEKQRLIDVRASLENGVICRRAGWGPRVIAQLSFRRRSSSASVAQLSAVGGDPGGPEDL